MTKSIAHMAMNATVPRANAVAVRAPIYITVSDVKNIATNAPTADNDIRRPTNTALIVAINTTSINAVKPVNAVAEIIPTCQFVITNVHNERQDFKVERSYLNVTHITSIPRRMNPCHSRNKSDPLIP